ncbi:MAG: serine/threonine-protein kinase [Polyangiaceae bacterium]
MNGTTIDGKYEVIRLLGQGGMGAVYEARHLGTGRRVAVKLIVAEALLRGGDIVARFQREARASGAIDSQHVVQVLDTGLDPATQSPYMVMEFLSGEDLQQVINRVGALPPELVLRVMAQACVGLQRAHDAGIVHRDIKSANMFLSARDGGEVVVKILDFGIAKVRADQFAVAENHGLTKTGSMLGSPLYMSPEQARGSKDLDSRSDIWSLGIAMYEALTGITPNSHCETIGSLIIAICSEQARPVQQAAPWVPAEVAAIVHRALMPDPARRFQTASEMNNAIAALLHHGSAIHSSMINSVGPEMKSFVAPIFAQTPWPLPRDSAVSSPALSPYASTTGNTTGGVGRTQNTAPPLLKPTSPALWALPLAVLLLAGVGFGAWKWRAATKAAAAQASTQASTAGPSLPTVETGTPTPPPLALPKLAHLTVSPAGATAEVDGKLVNASAGDVEIDGAVGSVHHVKLSSGGREISADVVIAESGVVPSHLEVPALAAASTHTSHSSSTKTPPATPSAGTQKPSSPSNPTATAKVPTTTPTVDRQM